MPFIRTGLIILVIAVTQGSCAALVVGGAAGAGGYYVGQDKRNIGEITSDATITSAINVKYVNDGLVSAFDINIDTYQGVVTLSGTVKTQAVASHAVVLARSTKNVKRVISHIAVRP